MKIALTAQWNDDFAEVAKLTVPIMQEYCLRHGYSFHELHIDSGVDVIGIRSRVILDLLPKYDAVVYVDADCLLTNLATPVNEVAPFAQQWHLAASGQGNVINDGVCIWRKSETTEIFLSNHISGKYGDKILQDAVALNPALIVYNPDPQSINACIIGEYEPKMPPHTKWYPGSFCLHLLAMGNERRIELINKHLPLVIR